MFLYVVEWEQLRAYGSMPLSCQSLGQDYKRFSSMEWCSSVLNSQSVLRNDVTLYCSARWVWDLFWVEFVFVFIVLAPCDVALGHHLFGVARSRR